MTEGVTTGKTKGISGSTVKIIAIVTMLIDHIGAVIVERYMGVTGMTAAFETIDNPIEWGEIFGAKVYIVYFGYLLLRIIGRMGFPLFIFLLVEGFKYTHSKLQYAIRLAIFALISEIPFNLAITNEIFAPGYQSVFVTLLLGFLFMWWDEYIHTKNIKKNLGIAGILISSVGFSFWIVLKLTGWGIPASIAGKSVAFGAFLLFAFISVRVQMSFVNARGADFVIQNGVSLTGLVILMFAADFFKTDYAGLGVLAIATAYAFRNNKNLSIAFCCLVLTVFNLFEVFAFADCLVILGYNGRKGFKLKYFFYAFYPVHLFLLHLISHMLRFTIGNWWGF